MNTERLKRFKLIRENNNPKSCKGTAMNCRICKYRDVNCYGKKYKEDKKLTKEMWG